MFFPYTSSEWSHDSYPSLHILAEVGFQRNFSIRNRRIDLERIETYTVYSTGSFVGKYHRQFQFIVTTRCSGSFHRKAVNSRFVGFCRSPGNQSFGRQRKADRQRASGKSAGNTFTLYFELERIGITYVCIGTLIGNDEYIATFSRFNNQRVFF